MQVKDECRTHISFEKCDFATVSYYETDLSANEANNIFFYLGEI